MIQITISVIISIILTLLVQCFIPKITQFIFNKHIQNYKHILKIKSEKQMAEFNKSITGFNKFFDEKYKTYPILHKKILTLHGILSETYGFNRSVDMNQLTLEQLNDYMEKSGFSTQSKREFIKKKERGEKISNTDISKSKVFIYDTVHKRTQNYYLSNELFVSQNTRIQIEQYLNNCQKIISLYENVTNSEYSSVVYEQIGTLHQNNGLLLSKLIEQMTEELKCGIIT